MKTISFNGGFAAAIGIIIAAAFFIVGGFFYSQHNKAEETAKNEPTSSSSGIKEETQTPKQETKQAEPVISRQAPKERVLRETPETHIQESNQKSWLQEWLSNQSMNFAAKKERPSWDILTEEEKSKLPDCKSILMTRSPVSVSSIAGIEPIGSANPPEHTLASISTDTYIGVNGMAVELVAPGDMWITMIVPRYGITQDPEDHVIKYAFCKDVYGVVDHVKGFSPEIKKIVDTYQCRNSADKPGSNNCPITVLEKVAAGTPLGIVGGKQGNFNFGTWDLRVTHSFISPWRHGFLTKHSTCPFQYFASPLKEELTAKLESSAGGNCGTVEYDIAGTLQGDWFIGDATPTRPSDWGKLLHFGTSNRAAKQSVISASGIFVTQPTKWVFTASEEGKINRKFSDVTPGSIYCYDNDGTHPDRNYEKGIITGKIIVELTSKTELQIEHQVGLCRNTEWQFTNPFKYQR